jgi:hypothetical protein
MAAALREGVQAGSKGEVQGARNARGVRQLAIQRLDGFDAGIPGGQSYRLHASSIHHGFSSSSAARWRAIGGAIECEGDFRSRSRQRGAWADWKVSGAWSAGTTARALAGRVKGNQWNAVEMSRQISGQRARPTSQTARSGAVLAPLAAVVLQR